MSLNDLLSDSVTRIRNAYAVKLKFVDLLCNCVVEGVCEILRDEGYIGEYTKKKKVPTATLR